MKSSKYFWHKRTKYKKIKLLVPILGTVCTISPIAALATSCHSTTSSLTEVKVYKERKVSQNFRTLSYLFKSSDLDNIKTLKVKMVDLIVNETSAQTVAGLVKSTYDSSGQILVQVMLPTLFAQFPQVKTISFGLRFTNKATGFDQTFSGFTAEFLTDEEAAEAESSEASEDTESAADPVDVTDDTITIDLTANPDAATDYNYLISEETGGNYTWTFSFSNLVNELIYEYREEQGLDLTKLQFANSFIDATVYNTIMNLDNCEGLYTVDLTGISEATNTEFIVLGNEDEPDPSFSPFCNNIGMTELKLDLSYTKLNKFGIASCNHLETITFANASTNNSYEIPSCAIGDGFSLPIAIKNIPANVTQIDSYAFCCELSSVSFENTEVLWTVWTADGEHEVTEHFNPTAYQDDAINFFQEGYIFVKE